MGIWDVVPDGDRALWSFAPLVGVGPLRFGMSPGEVAEALGAPYGVPAAPPGWEPVSLPSCTRLGVTGYFGAEGLAGVAVDALRGPQVVLEGTTLVARVPSVVEEWLCDYVRVRDLDLRYTHAADPGSADLGLIVRAQRAGDVVLTRPLLLVREWVTDSWDCIPGEEWGRF